MPFDGSGNFNRVRNWVNDALAHIKIKSDLHDSEDDNFASGLSNTLTKDGQSQPTADIPLNGHKLVNVANPVNPQDAATKNYADGVRAFNSGMRLTGASTGTSPNFVSTAFMGFTEADMAIVGRKADPAATPPVLPRLAFNDKVDGTGNDVFVINEDGSVTSRASDGTQKQFKPATAEARNRVVNGAMQISQENGNTAGATSGYYPADQWQGGFISSSAIGVGRAEGVNQPQGYLTMSASPAETSAAAGETAAFTQRIEGNHLYDFKFGAAGGPSVQAVIAFDVNVPVAGTYWVGLQNGPAITHSFLASYTIGAGEVGTWVRKSVVIPAGAINAGTWVTGTGIGAVLRFTWHCGSTFTGVAGLQAGDMRAGPGQALGLSAGANCNITNVGLYLDPNNTGVAPPFQMPDEAEELTACQRYWQLINASGWFFSANATSGATYYVGRSYLVPMRAAAAASGVNANAGGFPAAIGTLATSSAGVQEGRVCNASGTALFQSNITLNARL